MQRTFLRGGGGIIYDNVAGTGLYEFVPNEKKTFIEYLIALCLKVIENPESKMNIQNMSICLAPSFIRKKGDTIGSPSQQIIYSIFVNMLQYAEEYLRRNKK